MTPDPMLAEGELFVIVQLEITIVVPLSFEIAVTSTAGVIATDGAVYEGKVAGALIDDAAAGTSEVLPLIVLLTIVRSSIV